MSATPQNNDSQEIDLSQISKKIGGLLEDISTWIFKGILFIKRNIIWIGVLFFLGAGLGFYLDSTTKVYDNQIIVAPNFSSTDYLYAKVNLINSKIEEGDTTFLKNVVKIEEPRTIRRIEIKPITDVYKFIDSKKENFELIKLMAEDGDIKKIVEENLTSKNYPFHNISFITVKQINYERVVLPLLSYLNESDYYAKIQKEYLNNIKIKMVENDSIITQINGFLNTFNSTLNGPQKSDKLVYYNENSQLDEVIKTKDILINEQGSHRLELINLDKIVKEHSTTLNIRNNKAANGKMKLILPILFIGLFVTIGFLRSFYKYQMAKLNS